MKTREVDSTQHMSDVWSASSVSEFDFDTEVDVAQHVNTNLRRLTLTVFEQQLVQAAEQAADQAAAEQAAFSPLRVCDTSSSSEDSELEMMHGERWAESARYSRRSGEDCQAQGEQR